MNIGVPYSRSEWILDIWPEIEAVIRQLGRVAQKLVGKRIGNARFFNGGFPGAFGVHLSGDYGIARH
jgi:hypothetical protein